MPAPGLKSYIMGIVGLYEIRVYGKWNFENFLISATWGEECEYFENCFEILMLVLVDFSKDVVELWLCYRF